MFANLATVYDFVAQPIAKNTCLPSRLSVSRCHQVEGVFRVEFCVEYTDRCSAFEQRVDDAAPAQDGALASNGGLDQQWVVVETEFRLRVNRGHAVALEPPVPSAILGNRTFQIEQFRLEQALCR